MRAVGEKILLLTKDSLGTNQLVEGELARRAVVSQFLEDNETFTMLATNCASHQAVLCLKPVMTKIPGVCSNLTRLGHLFGNSKFHRLFMECVEDLGKKAIFREMGHTPAEVHHATTRARSILHRTRPAMDIGENDEDFILMMLNCDWDGTDLIHHHRINACACGGRDRFQENVRRALQVLLGAGCPCCFLYRWKKLNEQPHIASGP